jgi:ketosteroid isomerase-like protein
VEIQVAGDWAFARANVTGTATVDGTGQVVPVDTRQIVVFERGEGGAWRIARMISNSNAG